MGDDRSVPAKRILIVNDDVRLAQSAAALLAELGYESRLAYDGANGLDILLQWPADVVLLDLILPVLDGWGFLQQLRARAPERAPIVLVWSVAGADELARARNMGATECLSRATTGPTELLETIERLIEQSHLTP